MYASRRRGTAVQHPPSCVVSSSSTRGLAGDVHDGITERAKLRFSQGLREEVREIISCVNVRDGDSAVLDQLANVEMSPSDVFGPLVMLRIIR